MAKTEVEETPKSFTLRVKNGSHFLPATKENGKQKELTEGKVFKTDKPLHEMFENKFELIGSKADVAEDEEIDPWVEKTKFFAFAIAKGVIVERHRETKLYRVKDESGDVQLDGVPKDEVEKFFEDAANEDVEDADEEEEVVVEKKKKKAKKK